MNEPESCPRGLPGTALSGCVDPVSRRWHDGRSVAGLHPRCLPSPPSAALYDLQHAILQSISRRKWTRATESCCGQSLTITVIN